MAKIYDAFALPPASLKIRYLRCTSYEYEVPKEEKGGLAQYRLEMMLVGMILAKTTRRIVDHISMMERAITMTTDIQVTLIDNIYNRNSLLYQNVISKTHQHLSSLVFLSPSHGVKIGHRIAIDYINKFIGNLNLYIMIGSECWQEDNRITNYKKIWGHYKNVTFPECIYLNNIVLKNNKMVMFFSGIRLLKHDRDFIANLLEGNRNSFLILSDKIIDDELESFFQSGWNKYSLYPPDKALEFISQNGNYAATIIGEFDDAESGLAIFGKNEEIESISSKIRDVNI